MSTQVHPQAFVDPQARLGANVRVMPFAYVGPGVSVGDDCVIHNHAALLGPASFGRGNEFHPQCVLGAAPQDLKFKGGPTRLEVGDGNVFRESVTVHRGTEVDPLSKGVTRIGNKNLFMVGVHVAHDADIANQCILANAVLLAGHVKLDDYVVVGGASAMHHFVTVGKAAYVAGMTRVTHDVPPFMKVQGYDQDVRAVNTEGMRRWRFAEDSIAAVRAAFKLIYARKGGRSLGRTQEAIVEIRQNGLIHDPQVRALVEFLERKLQVGIFGRYREAARLDDDADRAGFYNPMGPAVGQPSLPAEPSPDRKGAGSSVGQASLPARGGQ
jgi:UDP-N-acetylglucosamine acyltransferase